MTGDSEGDGVEDVNLCAPSFSALLIFDICFIFVFDIFIFDQSLENPKKRDIFKIRKREIEYIDDHNNAVRNKEHSQTEEI
jgi:hypothetical protein